MGQQQKFIEIDLQEETLREHPLLKGMRKWDKNSDKFKGFVETVRLQGIIDPIIITEARVLVDGRHRYAAAKDLQLRKVPAQVVSTSEAASIILATLSQRRHYSKGALAYMTYPIYKHAQEEARKRAPERESKKVHSVHSEEDASEESASLQAVLGKRIEDFAALLGVSRRLFFQARDIHAIYAEDAGYREETEASIFDEDKPAGLGALIAGYGGRRSTKGKDKTIGNQLDLFEEGNTTWGHRFKYWPSFTGEDLKKATKSLVSTITSLPDEPLALAVAEGQRELKRRKQEEA